MMRAAIVVAAITLALPLGAAAQCLPSLSPPESAAECRERYPTWTGEMAAVGANALLGGISGGVLQELRGGSFRDGFLRGLAGGAVIYAGKRVAVERFGGAGLVGRQVVSVGASMVRNAGEGRGTFELIMLPLGPVRLYVQQSHPRVRVRADMHSLVWTVWAVSESELDFDAAKSLSAGAPVFRTEDRVIIANDDSTHAGGVVGSGVILLSDVPAFGRDFARRVFEHERAHVLQMDQIFYTITDPFEDFVLERIPGLRRAEPWIDINLADPLMRFLNGRIPKHLERPWETEAIYLSR
jgi:hypothetical protein